MSQRVSVVTTCDVCSANGEDFAAKPARFACNGITYAIDLCEDHAEGLAESLAPWVELARIEKDPLTPKVKKPARSADLAAIRKWALKQGYSVSERGRLSAQVRAAYAKAHAA